MKHNKHIFRIACVVLAAVFLFSCGKSGLENSQDESSAYIPSNDDLINKGGFDLTGGSYVSEGLVLKLPDSLQKVNITPMNTTGRIIPVDENFLIETDGVIETGELSKYVSLSPNVNYTLTKLSDKKFKLSPASSLRSGKLYRLVVGDKDNPAYSFAFQTESSLLIKGLIPGGDVINVPTDTGIEIQFSESVYGNDFEKFIEISPATEGSFNLYPGGKTVVFVPKTGLEENTVYTVTVKKGITSTSGKTLEEGRTVVFRTKSSVNEKGLINFAISYNDRTFHSSQYPIITCSGKSEIPITVTADIYRYNSAYEAIEAKKGYEEKRAEYFLKGETYFYPTEGLTKVTTWEKNYDSLARIGYLELPKLDKGCYLVNVTVSGKHGSQTVKKVLQTEFIVSDLFIYTEGCDGSLLVWVNENDAVAEGATVKGESFIRNNSLSVADKIKYASLSGKTDNSGVCLLETGNDDSAYIIISHNGDEAYACVSTCPEYNRTNYFSFVYSDRETYFPTDTINLFGVINPVKSGGKIPEKLYVNVYPYIDSDEITVNKDGTFEYSLDIENNQAGSLVFTFRDKDENVLFYKFVSVTKEDKPVYKASLEFDKPFYVRGDTGRVTIKAAFFDGTPAPKLKFSVSCNQILQNKVLTTDENGNAFVNFTIPDTIGNQQTSTYPVYLYFSAVLTGEETALLSVCDSVIYFHSNVYLTGTRINSSYSEIYLNKVDTSRITGKNDATFENTVGQPAEGRVSIILKKFEHKKRYSSTYYNPITKTSTVIYDYYTEETVIKDYTESFKNGVIKLEHIKADKNFSGYYMYEVYYSNPVTDNTYTYSLFALKSEETDGYYNRTPRYAVVTDKTEYSVGETVNVHVEYDNKPIDRKVLYTVYSQGRYMYAYTDSLAFEFKDDFVAGVRVYVTFIDGDYSINQQSSKTIYYDYVNNSSLDVEVETDKTAYKPGENATVKIKAGEAGATVILSVVDEACFAIQDQTVNALAQYYRSGLNKNYPISLNYRFSSGYEDYFIKTIGNYDADGYLSVEESSDGETKSVTSTDIRERFEDNPVFEIFTLDKKGEGVFNFEIPDNITQWRITVIVLSNQGSDKLSGMKIGHSVSDVICTLPYFINVSACEKYITGDDISVSARSYGSYLNGIKEVTYIARLYDEQDMLLSTKAVAVDSNEYARFNFGKFEKGSYYVTVEGKCDTYSDGVKAYLLVADTGVFMEVIKDIPVEDIHTINPQAYPVSLSFYDDTYNDFIKVARRITCGYSERSDTVAANFVGNDALSKLFGWDYDKSRAISLLSSYYGFIPLVSYGEGDVELTAKICAVAPDCFTPVKRNYIINQFYNFLEKEEYIDDIELAASLLGLAALGEPVLNDLTFIASHCEDFSTEAKLYLCAAFAYLGDFSSAKLIYNALYDEYAKTEGDRLYFKGGSIEESIKLTSLALLSASLVSKADAGRMVNYIMNNESFLDQYILELASYVRFFMPAEIKNSSFTYRIGDVEEQEITLSAGRVYTLTLTKKELANLKIISCDRAITVKARYFGTAEDATDGKAKSEKLSISKTIKPYDTDLGIYRVTIKYSGKTNNSYAYYTLSDCIPAGARFVNNRINNSSQSIRGSIYTGAYISNSGQMLTGGIAVWRNNRNPLSGNEEYSFSGEVSYFIRAAVQGEFVYESAIAVNTRDSTYALSERYKITINSGVWLINDK